MPALIPQPNVLKVRMLWANSADVDIGTSLFFTYSGTAPSNATCGTLAADFEAFGVSDLLGLVSTDVTLTGVEVTDLTSPTAGQGSVGVHHSGSRGSGVLPAGV